MGGAIAGTFARNFMDIMVFDLDPERVRRAVALGARDAGDAKTLIGQCDPILVSLPKSDTFVSVAENTLLPLIKSGRTVIDLGTTIAEETRRLCARFAEKGAFLLDAPVSGGPIGSAQGNLFIFVGGDKDAAQKQWPLLGKIGKGRLTYCGPSGAGQVTKAVNQLAMGLVNAAYMESVAYGVASGVDPAILMNAVGGDSGFRQQFQQVAVRIAEGGGDGMDNKYAEFKYFLNEADHAGFPAPMLRSLYDWMHRFPETARDNMNRPFPPFWSSLFSSGAAAEKPGDKKSGGKKGGAR
jgi:3-hydroxyisobutyrate dehydrogenase-like beta-hydroxyacid dehydrogenase